VRVQLGGSASYRVDAITSNGNIVTNMPVKASGMLSGNHLIGTIGAGQCPMRIINSSGNIEIGQR
jgi:hypothetical protein